MVRIAAITCQIGQNARDAILGNVACVGWSGDVHDAPHGPGTTDEDAMGQQAALRRTAAFIPAAGYWIGEPDAGRPVCTGAIGAESW
jgi:hypothetical protein